MKKILLSLLMSTSWAYAANHTVEMLSWKDGQSMIFSPAVLTVEPGDSVTFVPVQQGHLAASIVVPEGAQGFSGKINEEFTVTLDTEGLYLYTCSPHRLMNMTGIIRVGTGRPSNYQAVSDAVTTLESQAQMNKGRVAEYFTRITE